jgi:molecular chaperone GrpE
VTGKLSKKKKEDEVLSEENGSMPKDKKEEHLEVNVVELDSKIIELTNQLEQERDKFLRLFAEFDNFKKRTQKEKENLYYDSICDCIKQILPISDNLERALTSGGDFETLKKGLTMVLTQLNSGLTNLGVEEISTEIPFDPNLHNAVMHIEDDEAEQGKIVETFQKGYKIKDKIIRYAMVKVAN